MSSATRTLAACLKAADEKYRAANVADARRHLSSLSAERRAMLEAEWDAPVSDGRRTGPEAF